MLEMTCCGRKKLTLLQDPVEKVLLPQKVLSTGFWVRKDNKANGVLVVQHRAADHAQGIGCGSAYRRARSVGPLDSGPSRVSPGPDPLQVPPQTSPLLRGPVLGQTCPNR